MLTLCIAVAANTYLSGGIAARGLGQSVRTLADSIDAASGIFAPVAVALIACARFEQTRLFRNRDLLSFLALIAALASSGNRATAISVVLVTTFAYTARPSKRSKLRPILLAAPALVAFAYAVVTYRSMAVPGYRATLSPIETILQDLASVPFTTGVTYRLTGDYLEGASIVAGLLRQMPGPLATSILGQPDDTGAFVFRRLLGVPDNMGYGFSLPAEGVLNFGMIGALLVPLSLGAALAWLYARATFNASRAVELAYYIALAALPFAWRSDTLGALKSILYPVIGVWIVFVVARTMAPRVGQPSGPHSTMSGSKRQPPAMIPTPRSAAVGNEPGPLM